MVKPNIEKIRAHKKEIINTPEWLNIYCKHFPSEFAESVYEFVLAPMGW